MKTQTINPNALQMPTYFQHENNFISQNHSEKEIKAKALATKKQDKIEVIVVDDDKAYNKALVNYLKEHFGETTSVTSFQTGEQCLDILEKKDQVIILDYFLNSRFSDAMNGISVLNIIKKKNPNAEVLMLSGQDKLEIAVSAMRNGAHNYIVKGESAFPQIFNSVRNIIHNYALRSELKRYRNMTIAAIAGVLFIVGLTIALEVYTPGIFNY